MQELSILRRDSGALFQCKRTVRLPDGSWIQVAMAGEQPIITIYAVPGSGKGPSKPTERPEEISCFCTCCFSEGVVTKVIGIYGDFGAVSMRDVPYPLYCQDAAVYLYNGIRYQVNVCQRDTTFALMDLLGNSRARKYICTSTDFNEYQAGDRVMVWFRGKWRGASLDPGAGATIDEPCSYEACEGSIPPWHDGVWMCDGTYVITPILSNHSNIDDERVEATHG